MTVDLITKLRAAKQVAASDAEGIVPRQPGYYSIWVDDPKYLPPLYAERLWADETSLIYVGIATKSLHKRLLEQDLHHKNPSTFFRGIGPVLGYRPHPGSLVGMANQNNYKFSKTDTVAIIEWIELHLSVRYVEVPCATADTEKGAIHSSCPLFNTTHNPRPMRELALLRRKCREIARGPA